MAQINEKLEKLLKEVGEVVDLSSKNSAVWSLPQNQRLVGTDAYLKFVQSMCYDCKA
mgnify:CR=1 FL=1